MANTEQQLRWIPRRLPAPRAPRPSQFIPNPGPDRSIAPAAVKELVSLQQEVCRASGRNTFAVWRDWLETLAPWLAAVRHMGELAAQAALPPAVADLYTQLEERYSRAAIRYPAALRTMSDNFTRMWQILNQHTPRFDPTQLETSWDANPDILGQAFLSSLKWPAAWSIFFPHWSDCLTVAEQLIPAEASKQIYQELAAAHFRASLAMQREIGKPVPADDAGWTDWLRTILPFANLPLIVAEEVTAVTLLPALAARFSPWLVRGNALVQFAWPRLASDPVLGSITAINAMLMGLNGFYLSKNAGDAVAIEQLARALIELETTPPSPPPNAVFAGPLPDDPIPPNPNLPSFAELFRRPL